MPNVCTNDVDKVISLDKVSPAEKSILTFILAMQLDKQEQLQKFCQTVNAKCTTSVMLYEQKQPPLKVRAPAVPLFRSVNSDMMAKMNNDLPVTHVATGVIKDSPLYKYNGLSGDKHLLSAPSQSIVCKALESFINHEHTFTKATFVVDDTKKSRNLFKKWKRIDVTGLNQSGSPMIAFTWNRPQVEDDTVYRYSTEEQSMQFKGTVEK